MKNRSLFDILAEGLEDAIAWEQGKIALRVTRFRDPGPPPRYGPEDVVRLRESKSMTREPARFLHVSPTAVANWERGRSTPSTHAARQLQLIEDPGLWARMRIPPTFMTVDQLDDDSEEKATPDAPT